MNLQTTIREGLGWYGVLAIAVAYGLVSLEVLPTQHIIYILLNLTGSAGLIIGALDNRDWQPIVLNVIWLGVGIISLVRLFIHG